LALSLLAVGSVSCGTEIHHVLPPDALLFGHSEKMRAVERLVTRVADTKVTVLIHGETGVGKEAVAKAVHCRSERAHHPWIKLNCAALPADLLESELFGHERGAFTGASARKLGRFELADNGTFLLDEISEMPLGLQSKILHVIQDNEFFRVGGRELIRVDARLIAVTNQDLGVAVANGTFREDLYYRLNVVSIHVPPLRERREEIPALVSYFQEDCLRLFNRRLPKLTDATLALLQAYSWPGNVRELENLIRRWAVLGDEEQMRREAEGLARREQMRVALPTGESNGTPAPGAGLREIGRRAAYDAEQRAIREVLEAVRWNRTEAARRLKVSYNTLLSKMQAGELLPPRPLPSADGCRFPQAG
jgi:transcriptional regulator with GAF, ATPase, and Fis domain